MCVNAHWRRLCGCHAECSFESHFNVCFIFMKSSYLPQKFGFCGFRWHRKGWKLNFFYPVVFGLWQKKSFVGKLSWVINNFFLVLWTLSSIWFLISRCPYQQLTIQSLLFIRSLRAEIWWSFSGFSIKKSKFFIVPIDWPDTPAEKKYVCAQLLVFVSFLGDNN